jgi:hypothetical protein
LPKGSGKHGEVFAEPDVAKEMSIFMSSIIGVGQNVLHYLQHLGGNLQSASQQSQSAGSGQPLQNPGFGDRHALMAKIESAVTTALQSSPSNASANPDQVIQNAITQVLSANAGSTQSTASTSQSPTDNESVQANFIQTLKEFGIDPQQFRQDLFSALQNFKGGATGANAASQLFPSGSILNTAI